MCQLAGAHERAGFRADQPRDPAPDGGRGRRRDAAAPARGAAPGRRLARHPPAAVRRAGPPPARSPCSGDRPACTASCSRRWPTCCAASRRAWPPPRSPAQPARAASTAAADRVVDPAVGLDVRRPIGGHHEDAHATDRGGFGDRAGQVLSGGEAACRDAVRLGQRHEVEAVRRAEQGLEAFGRQRRRLRQEREDAAAVVVDDDAQQVQVPAGRAEQPVAVVEEGHVADQQRGRASRAERRPDRGGHDPVDPIRATVREDAAPRRGARRSARRRGSASTTTRPATSPPEPRARPPGRPRARWVPARADVRLGGDRAELAVGGPHGGDGGRPPAVEPARRGPGGGRGGGQGLEQGRGGADHRGRRGRRVGPAGCPGDHLVRAGPGQPLVDHP